MPDYHKYLMRYGENGVQALLEMIERNEGIRYEAPLPLELRWHKVMEEGSESEALAA